MNIPTMHSGSGGGGGGGRVDPFMAAVTIASWIPQNSPGLCSSCFDILQHAWTDI